MAHYPYVLFTNIHERGGENVRLWLVKKDGDVAAGACVFYHNQHAVYWHGAMAERFSELRPANLLHFEIIRDACQRGFRWYDFNPSGPNEGVVRFKDSFGAQRLYYDRAVLSGNPLLGLATLASDALKRVTWRFPATASPHPLAKRK
jgi:lipid II:glycine glycyltransferase (peptidoglycan interpeptide bridge formation enzyme)